MTKKLKLPNWKIGFYQKINQYNFSSKQHNLTQQIRIRNLQSSSPSKTLIFLFPNKTRRKWFTWRVLASTPTLARKPEASSFYLFPFAFFNLLLSLCHVIYPIFVDFFRSSLQGLPGRSEVHSQYFDFKWSG